MWLPDADPLIGSRRYELTNHLGNVMAVISDKRIPVDVYWEAEVINANDYYPGGMQMPGKIYSSAASYRYGFNGKENDNEIKGEGNQQNYGLRIYDLRLCRFLSVDPLTPDYPWYSPYQFSGNMFIAAVDLDGAEPQGFMEYWDKITTGLDRWGRSVEDIYDYQTKQTWSIMREPNSSRLYYWQQYSGFPGKWDNDKYENNFDNQSENWKGKWVEFKPRHASEMDIQIARAIGITTFMTAGIISGYTAFAEAGVVLTPILENQVLKLMVNLYPRLPVIGSAGRGIAEIFDETGTVGLANAGRVKLISHSIEESKGMLGGSFNFDNGSTLDFLSNYIVNGNTLELTDAITYLRGVTNNDFKNTINRGIYDFLNSLKQYAKEKGFKNLRISGKRVENSSSANPGHEFDITYKLE